MGDLVSGVEGLAGDVGGSVTGLLGGGKNGAHTVAQSANLIQPVTETQVNQGLNTATQGLTTEQQLINALSNQGGVQNQSNVFNQDQGLVNQYSDLASGLGPNPAQAQLAQSTGNNIAAQNALMAGQRGVGSNAGLLARQAAMQGANIQQQAVGQGATLQAQQELSALGAKQGALNNLGSLATNQVGQQIGATNALNSTAQTNQNSLLNALGNYNSAQVGNVDTQNKANASIANNNANNTSDFIGGALNGLGASGILGSNASAGLALLAEGGEVDQAKSILAQALAKKKMPDHMRGMAEIYHPNVLKMCDGGMAKMAEGAVVPGSPKVPGKNTVKNDVVPAMLTPKEIVLPLSVTQAKNPGEAAKSFVEHIKGKDSNGDFKQALREHVSKRKSKK